MNIIKNVRAKLVAGLFACLSLGAAAAATVTVDLPAEGGTVDSETVANSAGTWYFNGAGRPSWVSSVVLRYNNSRITVGTGTLTYGILKQGFFSVTAPENDTGAARSWTWDILSAKGGSTVVTLQVNQPAVPADPEVEDDGPITFSVSASKDTYTSYVKVTWEEGDGAASYNVYRSTAEDFDSATKLGATENLYWTDKSVTAGTKYWYFVRAVDEDGVEHENESSDYGSAKLSISIPKPVATDGKYTGYVALTWKTVSGVSKYLVYRSTTTNIVNGSCIGYATKGSAYDKTATLGTKYYYWVLPVIGSNAYYNNGSCDAGYRKVVLKVTTPKTLKLGKVGALTLTVNGQTLTRGNFKLSYSSSYLTVLPGTGKAFCRIKGKKAGTAKLTVTYGDTAAAKVSWTVKIVK